MISVSSKQSLLSRNNIDKLRMKLYDIVCHLQLASDRVSCKKTLAAFYSMYNSLSDFPSLSYIRTFPPSCLFILSSLPPLSHPSLIPFLLPLSPFSLPLLPLPPLLFLPPSSSFPSLHPLPSLHSGVQRGMQGGCSKMPFPSNHTKDLLHPTGEDQRVCCCLQSRKQNPNHGRERIQVWNMYIHT